MVPTVEYYDKYHVMENLLTYLTQWLEETDIPTLQKFQEQVLKDPSRTAVIVKDEKSYALAVDKVTPIKYLP
jgi:hypothetical protein